MMPCGTILPVPKKIRTIIHLDPEVREALERLSAETGAGLGELIRRGLSIGPVGEGVRKTLAKKVKEAARG